MTPDPKDGKKHPAILWITGGDCNSIGDIWTDEDPLNEQNASAYRKAGIVMMVPSFRGGNTNPGKREGFLGEVDDVIAAHAYLASLPYVNPTHIYLGGHSTGGTLALLVAESTDMFRAIFSFGPMSNPYWYWDYVYCDTKNESEMKLRRPIEWLEGISRPTFVFEGDDKPGNALHLLWLKGRNKNAKVQFFMVKNCDHFTILDPVNRLVASRILKDSGPQSTLAFTDAELARLFSE
ncbi:MAG: prolyl oligopeptidase family serine peptidase [Planctomycetes bacterium]|nr:prolyl oligopeptidase family serine peptidase [Planctomycetota bacterium]